MKNLILKNNQIKIINLNINLLISRNKRTQFVEFIKKENPETILLTETKLKPKYKINFPGYDRNDRLTDNGGGTAILIKSIIKHEVVNTPPHLYNIETSLLKIQINNHNQYLYVGACYIAPNRELKHEEIKIILDLIRSENSNNLFILGGDFNARHEDWFNRRNNGNGNKLKTMVDNNINKIKILHTMIPTQ